MRLKSYRIFFAFFAFEFILGIFATTHWIVTENGRIQSMPDSIFQMLRPHDLISFLEQENLLDSIHKLHESLRNRKAIIDRQFVGLRSGSDLENSIHMTDIDCILRQQYDNDLDFHSSMINFQEELMLKTLDFDDVSIDEKQKIPDCKKTFPLDFSMHTFEHLIAMRNRRKLTQSLEKYSLKSFSLNNMDFNILGNKAAYGLMQNNTSWLYLNSASVYWQMKGDIYNALECVRRAIVKAPRQYRDIPLLNAAQILHSANQSSEAAIILHTAIEYAPTKSLHHFFLANIYTYLGEFNKSIEYYDNSLKLEPSLNISRREKHNILCNLKIESSLRALHQQLLDVLLELQAYHSEHNELLSFQEKILWEHIKQMPFLTSQDGIHDDSLNSILTNRGQSCMQRDGDESILSCDVISEKQMISQKLQIDFGVSLQVLKNVENQAKEIRERMTKSKITTENIDQFSQILDYSKISTVSMEPTGRPKYHNFEIKKSSEQFEKPDWPSEFYCETLMPFIIDIKEYIPVYLPPENKGYITYLFLNELIGIDPEEKPPLPWYPPICQTPKSFDHNYIPPELVKAAGLQLEGYTSADISLIPVLGALVSGADILEIGQRILTATNSKVTEPWVLSILASLYWRVMGNHTKALDCLQLALDSVPNKFRDVPLINIASISHKYNLIDNALSVTEEAFTINSVEPLTNFLYGTLLYIKGNYSGAIHHLKQTLRVELHAINGRAMTMLQTIACQERFSIARHGDYREIF